MANNININAEVLWRDGANNTTDAQTWGRNRLAAASSGVNNDITSAVALTAASGGAFGAGAFNPLVTRATLALATTDSPVFASATMGSQTANGTSSSVIFLGKSSGGLNLSATWTMRANAYYALDTYAVTDAIRVDASNGRVAFTRGMEGDSYYNGKLAIGSAAPADENAGILVVSKGYSTATGNHHAIRVTATDGVLATGAGINLFDAQAIVNSPNNIDHIAEFQGRSTRSGTGTMNDWFGFFSLPVLNGGATTRATHIHIEDVGGSGTLNTQYGVRIKPLARGTSNYGVVVEGNNGSVMGGTTPNASAILDLQSTTKPFMPPRMTTTQKNAVASPAAGMVIYDSTLNKLAVYTGSVWETLTSV